MNWNFKIPLDLIYLWLGLVSWFIIGDLALHPAKDASSVPPEWIVATPILAAIAIVILRHVGPMSRVKRRRVRDFGLLVALILIAIAAGLIACN